MKFILLILPIFFFSCKQTRQVKPGDKVIDLEFGFKAITGNPQDFQTFKTYLKFELYRNDKLILTDSSEEYEFGDKMYPLLFKTGNDSFELLFEINGRPNKNYLNRFIINNDKIVSQEKLPTFIGKPVDIDNDGVKEYAGFLFYGQGNGDMVAYNPILYYSITPTGLHLDSALTKQRNELIYGQFYGYVYSEQFEKPISVKKKFEEEIKLFEASSN